MDTLKKLRLEANLSQRGLARLCGLSSTAISRIEYSNKITPKTIYKLAKVLAFDKDEMMIAYGFLPEFTKEFRYNKRQEIKEMLKEKINGK